MIVLSKNLPKITTSKMILKVKVYPNSKEYKIEKRKKDEWQVWVKEKAEQGKANEALLTLLSDDLKIPRGELRIIRGRKNRNKWVQIL